MKKLVLLFLAVVMLFSLCSCESSDYKMAMMLLKCGEYQSAEKMFLDLGEFEDAPEKVLRCRYEVAKELMEKEKYTEAAEKFDALGEYRDSAQQVPECYYLLAKKYIADKDFDNAKVELIKLADYKDCKSLRKGLDWDALTAYFDQAGEATRDVSESCFTTLSMSDGVLEMEYIWKIADPAKLDLKITMTLDREENIAITGSESYVGFSEEWKANGTTTLKIAEYPRGGEVKWENFDVTGFDANGLQNENIPAIPLRTLLSAAVKEMTYLLESALDESTCGVAMKDLGFAAY